MNLSNLTKITIAAGLRDLYITITHIDGKGYGWIIMHGASNMYRVLLTAAPKMAAFEVALKNLRETLESCCRPADSEEIPVEDMAVIEIIIASLHDSSRSVETRLLINE
jgi:hypothetical protein